MASACINNVGVSPENFVDRSPAKYKSSYSLDPEVSVNEMVDFEFRLEHPVNMLPADELFSGGKLMPLQLPTIRPVATTSTSPGVSSPDAHKLRTDVSTKAPRCCSRWKELLGLKKLPHQDKHEAPNRNWKNLLINRSSKPDDDDSSLNLPLLNKDTTAHDHCYNNECISISCSRLSLSSSSSSSHEHDDLPRLSLDSDKPNSTISNPNPPRIRLVKHRSSALSSENPKPADSTSTLPWGLSIDDSPRMNSSGKIIFHNLGRSASSPSSFNTRYKHGGSVERSYSANVRVTPVLNVPVCRRSSKSGVFGFPHFSSSSSQQQKKDATVSVNKKHHSSSRPNKTDRIKE